MLSKESIVLVALDLRFASREDELARESCEKRQVAVVELEDAVVLVGCEVKDGKLRPVVREA